MEVKVIYRYYLGENSKARPPYYSKELALASLLRALEHPSAPPFEAVFLIDGGKVDDSLGTLMRQYGEQVTITGGNTYRSFGQAVRIPRVRQWDDDAIVLLSEDDYLYQPDAIVELSQAAKNSGEHGYFAPYAQRSDFLVDLETAGNSGEWLPARSTTSTYAAHAGTLKMDERLLRLTSYAGAAWDSGQFLTLAGTLPYPWKELRRDILERSPEGGRVKRLARSGVRVVSNLRSHRRSSHRHRLTAAWPPVATHMESAYLAEGRDWESVVEQTRLWLEAKQAHS